MVISGGYGFECRRSSLVEVISGDSKLKWQLPNLPMQFQSKDAMASQGNLIFQHDGFILMCGGWQWQCLIYIEGIWKVHSVLNHGRYLASVVTTRFGTYIFGGYFSPKTYEYLPSSIDSRTWQLGKTEIPDGFQHGCAIAIKSDQYILLIGGSKTRNRILCFDVLNKTFTEYPTRLEVGRSGHRCCMIPGTRKVMITGGLRTMNSTEIFDTTDQSIEIGSMLNLARYDHGIGVLTINSMDRIAVFGGYDWKKTLNSVEIYNPQTKTWEISDIEIKEARAGFGFLNVQLWQLD